MPDKPDAKKAYDRLTRQLYHLPSIIARLAISVAEGQRELDAVFMGDLSWLLNTFTKHTGTSDKDSPSSRAAVLTEIATALGATRYQFTETTIEFKADLAESMDVGATVGVSAGVPAVSVSASGSVAFGYDYNAAARISTVLHARPLDAKVMRALLKRASEIPATELPDSTKIEPNKQIEGMVKALSDAIPETAEDEDESEEENNG